jgi:hypothetical protein
MEVFVGCVVCLLLLLLLFVLLCYYCSYVGICIIITIIMFLFSLLWWLSLRCWCGVLLRSQIKYEKENDYGSFFSFLFLMLIIVSINNSFFILFG